MLCSCTFAGGRVRGAAVQQRRQAVRGRLRRADAAVADGVRWSARASVAAQGVPHSHWSAARVTAAASSMATPRMPTVHSCRRTRTACLSAGWPARLAPHGSCPPSDWDTTSAYQTWLRACAGCGQHFVRRGTAGAGTHLPGAQLSHSPVVETLAQVLSTADWHVQHDLQTTPVGPVRLVSVRRRRMKQLAAWKERVLNPTITLTLTLALTLKCTLAPT